MRFLRGWMVWAALTVCALMVLGTMTALTHSVLRSEHRRAYFEDKADLQENMRLALSHMETVAVIWLTDEAQRPVLSGEAAEDVKPEVLLRFEAREDGAVVSENPERVLELKDALKITDPQGTLFASLGGTTPPVPRTVSNLQLEGVPVQSIEQRATPGYQQAANSKEKANRTKVVNMALNQTQQTENIVSAWANVASNSSSAASWQLLQAGMPQPVMIGSELFLLRHLVWRMPNDKIIRTIQGSWIDEPSLQRWLMLQVTDFFPHGSLKPATAKGAAAGLTLSTFPFWQLDPGASIERKDIPLPRAISVPLGAGWAAALIATATASLLVRGVMRLSERRASFVSAVTHELRTPLTTFRLYSEMLESGAVREEKRGDYLRILSREADRLAHLVENVLAFSRIERGSARTAVREASVREILEPLRERFEARLTIAGMDLHMPLEEADAGTQVKIDAAAVEHILFNLVDNAAKYATNGYPPEVSIRVAMKGSSLGIYVEDNGPGIPSAKRDRMFQPFHKSARDAAESRPGVGLGLALSRRLAQTLGGDLHYERRQGKTGACFRLKIPLP